QRLPYFACRIPSSLTTYTAVSVIETDIYVVTKRIVGQCMLQCCRMVVTIYQRVTKLFRPTWQHHHLMIASTIALTIQFILGLIPGADQYGRPHPRLDASLLR